MAVDIFLKLDGVKGEAQDHKHKEEIDILSWSWGMSQQGATQMGSGGGAGKVSVQDISVSKNIDKSSPTLAKFCSDGTHIKKGLLTVRKAGKHPLEYLKIELEEIIISGVNFGGTDGSDLHKEQVSLNFAKFKTIYTTQADDGSAGPQTEMSWDIPKNKDH